jgi:hypothetical protein
MIKQIAHEWQVGALLPLLVSLGLSGCDRGTAAQSETDEVDLILQVDPDPPRQGPSHLGVVVRGADGSPVGAESVAIEATMDHPGMQPLHAKAHPAAAGGYEAPFMWTMPGAWQVAVTAVLDEGRSVTRHFGYEVGAGNAGGKDRPGHVAGRVPNKGAAVRILSPRDGARFAPGEEVRVEIDTENFLLGEQGNHWHVYIDGGSSRMIMGKINDAVLRDLTPGPHEISAYLSVGSHREMEEGAAVKIEVMGDDAG